MLINKINIVYLVLNFILLYIIASCSLDSNKSNNGVHDNKYNKVYNSSKNDSVASFDSLDASFKEFFNLFHKDREFQMSRINFPVGGGTKVIEYNEADSNLQSVTKPWSRQNWKTYKDIEIDTSIYTVEFIPRGDSIIKYKVYINNSGFYTETRFKKINGKWYLTYSYMQNL